MVSRGSRFDSAISLSDNEISKNDMSFRLHIVNRYYRKTILGRLALTLSAGEGYGASMAEDASNTPPDRLSLDPRSPYFDEALLSRGVGIKFNGQEKTSVIEYSISEGWIRVAAGKSRDRYGQPMTLKLNGKVEPYFENPPEDAAGEESAD